MTRRASIRRALGGTVVLVTGATGFLGKVIVERLLRTAPEIERIYLLIRAARAPAAVRFETEVLASEAFAALAARWGAAWPAFAREKLVPVAGDVSRPRLGLADEVHDALTSQLDFIVNAAASVTFDAPIDEALRHNTRSVRHVAAFARACRSASLVHVSTAFVAGRQHGHIAEDALPVDRAELDAVEAVVDTILDDQRQRPRSAREARARLVEAGMTRAKALGWHDSYTYTKALGEAMLGLHRGDVPTAIVRPTIIESSLDAPTPGWLENLNVGDPLFVEFGRGRIPDFPLGRDTVFDIVPVDFVANAVVAILPRVAEAGPRVTHYAVGSGSINPLTGARLYELTHEYFLRHPMCDREGRPIAPPRWTFPTPEGFRVMFGDQSPTRALRRLLYLADLYEGYANVNSVFETTNTRQLLEALADEDRETLDFDVRRIDWPAYIQDVHIPGLKRHVLGEGPASGIPVDV